MLKFTRLSAALTTFLVLTPFVQAQQSQSATTTTVASRSPEFAVTHFYTQPNLPGVFQAVETMVSQGKQTDILKFESLALFFSEIFRKSPDMIPVAIQHFSKYKNDLNVMPWMAAWFADTDQGRAFVAKLKETGYTQIHSVVTAAPPVDIRSFQPRNKAVIDSLWLYFYASGSLQDLAMIFETAMFDKKDAAGNFVVANEGQRDNLRDYATGSLLVHAAQHPAVFQFLVKAQEKAPKEVQDKVRSVLNSAVVISKKMVETGKSLDQVLQESAPAN